ncbi:MAG: hypothetical protein FWF55_10110 [Treponema sp.]|nr:hypothetical protein [Treponema sp.]
MRRPLFFLCFFLTLSSLPAQRSFNDIFPGVPPAIREAAFSEEGYYRSTKTVQRSVLVGSDQSAIDPQLIESILSIQPGFLVESILVIPGKTDEFSLLDAYNALGKIRGLKGRLYRSHTRKEYVPLFEDVTRIESEKKNNPIPDPAPVSRIPPSETIYMRVKDVNFGNTHYRGDMTLAPRGLYYTLYNNKNITYFFIPVIKEGKLKVQLYFEPIIEGIMIYALAGAEVSDLVASRVDMPSAIRKRLAVIISWVAEGISDTGKS